MARKTSWETNGVCEFILATFPILFRDVYIYIYGSGGGVQLRRHIALEPWEGGREGREGFHARITRDQRKVH